MSFIDKVNTEGASTQSKEERITISYLKDELNISEEEVRRMLQRLDKQYAIVNGKYIELLFKINNQFKGTEDKGTEDKGTEDASTQSEKCITIFHLIDELQINEEVASIIIQRLIDDGIIKSKNSDRIETSQEMLQRIMIQYLKKNAHVIKDGEEVTDPETVQNFMDKLLNNGGQDR